MINIGVARAWVRYYALRLFGWKAWRGRIHSAGFRG